MSAGARKHISPAQIVVRQISSPLVTPYKLSSGDLECFDPFIIQVQDAGGHSGWGECLIVPGYTEETVEGSWEAATAIARALVQTGPVEIASVIEQHARGLPGIASTFHSAFDMLGKHERLFMQEEAVVPLLAPCQGEDPGELREEIEALLEQGYRTLKVKVGFDWREDLERVEIIQRLLASRGKIRLDANRGFNPQDGIAFGSRLAPQDIELFEQPCASEDWQANARVAEVSTVPVMLDESIYGLSDIERAGALPNVQFVKLKLKKMGTSEQLLYGLERIRALGMTPVLGDGVSCDLGCWLEACIAHRAIDNAGEMNGFLKTRFSLFENPMPFTNGAIHLPAGYWPVVDEDRLHSCTIRKAEFS